jgi:hypothetical protein
MRVNRGVVLVAGLFLAAALILAGYYHLRAGDGKNGTPPSGVRVAPGPEPLTNAPVPARNPSPVAPNPIAPVATVPPGQFPVPPPTLPIPAPPPSAPVNPVITDGVPQLPKAPLKDSLWTITVDLKDGKTLLVAKARSRDVEFHVKCDAVDLHAPNGSIQARGNVKVSAGQLDAAGQSLTLQLHDDQLLLEGQARVTQRGDGQDLELRAERLTLRLLMAPVDDKKK